MVALLAAVLGQEALLQWGWRIAFFLALPMGAVALWLRLSLKETPAFIRSRQAAATPALAPGAGVMSYIIALGISRLMAWSAAGYTFLVIMPTYLQSALHTHMQTALLIAVISNTGFALTIIPAGMLSDRIGRRRVLMTATVLLLALSFPLLRLLQNPEGALLIKGLAVFIAGSAVGLLAGPGPAILAEMFPTRVRYTGLGLAYSLSNAVFSGCAGLMITWLIKQTGNLDIPAWYVVITAIISFFALMTLNKDDHVRELDDTLG